MGRSSRTPMGIKANPRVKSDSNMNVHMPAQSDLFDLYVQRELREVIVCVRVFTNAAGLTL